MNTKKVVDWIKLKNYKDNSRNLSALEGLKRTNSILSKITKLFFCGYLIYLPIKYFLKDVENVLKNSSNILNKLYTFQNIEKIFLNAHNNSIINLFDEIVIIYNLES